jgi:hypothetical protein
VYRCCSVATEECHKQRHISWTLQPPRGDKLVNTISSCCSGCQSMLQHSDSLFAVLQLKLSV